jgi:hypothetical protein
VSPGTDTDKNTCLVPIQAVVAGEMAAKVEDGMAARYTANALVSLRQAAVALHAEARDTFLEDAVRYMRLVIETEKETAAPGAQAAGQGARRQHHHEVVDVMWGTDMSQTVTLTEGVAHVFVAVDHCNSECVGIHANKSANRFQALEPVRQGVR